MDAIVVGIDVSKDRLDVHVMPSGDAFLEANDAAGIETLSGRLLALSPALVALEATGGFETVAAAALSAAGLPVVVVNPAQVRSFADALGKRALIETAITRHDRPSLVDRRTSCRILSDPRTLNPQRVAHPVVDCGVYVA